MLVSSITPRRGAKVAKRTKESLRKALDKELSTLLKALSGNPVNIWPIIGAVAPYLVRLALTYVATKITDRTKQRIVDLVVERVENLAKKAPREKK